MHVRQGTDRRQSQTWQHWIHQYANKQHSENARAHRSDALHRACEVPPAPALGVIENRRSQFLRHMWRRILTHFCILRGKFVRDVDAVTAGQRGLVAWVTGLLRNGHAGSPWVGDGSPPSFCANERDDETARRLWRGAASHSATQPRRLTPMVNAKAP